MCARLCAAAKERHSRGISEGEILGGNATCRSGSERREHSRIHDCERYPARGVEQDEDALNRRQTMASQVLRKVRIDLCRGVRAICIQYPQLGVKSPAI